MYLHARDDKGITSGHSAPPLQCPRADTHATTLTPIATTRRPEHFIQLREHPILTASGSKLDWKIGQNLGYRSDHLG